MPSPQAIQKSEPTIAMRLEGALLFAVCIFLGFVLPLLLRSSFDGVWFKTGGDPNAIAELKLLAHSHKFSEIVPVNCFGEYETVTLVADGGEHPWSQPAGACRLAFEPGITSYSAQLTDSSFKLTKRAGSVTYTESWKLIGHSRMVVLEHGQTATYQRASWLRSLFTEEP